MFDPDAAFMGTDGSGIVLAGRQLSPGEARKFAYRFRQDNSDLRSLFFLLGYYSNLRCGSVSAEKARCKIILWIIENQPFHPVCRRWCRLADIPAPDQKVLRKAEELWLKQIERFSNNAQVLTNAGWFFYWSRQKEKAESLLLQAIDVEPENPAWHLELASYFNLERMLATFGKKRTFARRALSELELASKYESSGRVSTCTYRLERLAWYAYQAGENKKAAGYANSILGVNADESDNGKSPGSVHQAFLVLGSIAFDRGDMREATKHLIASVTVPIKNDYEHLFPDMSLARRLLRKGERTAVLEFLEKSLEVCSDYGDEKQKRRGWIEAIKNNTMLKFERAIDYRHY